MWSPSLNPRICSATPTPSLKPHPLCPAPHFLPTNLGSTSNRLCDFKIFQRYIYSGSLAPLLKLTFKYRLIFQGDSLEYSFTLVRVVCVFSDACSHPPPSSLSSFSLFPSFFNKYFGACTLCLAACWVKIHHACPRGACSCSAIWLLMTCGPISHGLNDGAGTVLLSSSFQ